MTIDTSGAMKKLSKAERQVNFATAKALTLTAKDAQLELTGDLPEIFEEPTAFTKRALAIIPANKTTLTSYVFVKDQQVPSLARQQVGGTRRPEKGSPILVPVKQRTNRSGNIPKGAVARAAAKDNTFFASGKTARTRHLPPGLYERSKRGKRRAGGQGTKGALRVGYTGRAKKAGGSAFRGKVTSLKLLVALEERAQYKPRFEMHERVGRSVLKTFPNNFNKALRDALKSAK